MRIILFLFIMLACSSLHSQSRADNWYFGHSAGIVFNNGIVEVSDAGKIVTSEGCSSISDSNGNLLFYTDGMNVWNKMHEQMPNGFGLFGHSSAAQSALIVPNPANNDIYYIFTVDYEDGANGLNYSVVDMSQLNGLGDVVNKNVFLADSVTEKLAGTENYKKDGFWVVAHKRYSNIFLVYSVDSSGVAAEAVKIPSGSVLDKNTNFRGYMKFSPDGKMLASVIQNKDQVEIFDFNYGTGSIKNPRTLTLPMYSKPYGLEFSSAGRLMYISSTVFKEIYQFDMTDSDIITVQNSLFTISMPDATETPGALQMGPDLRIYISMFKTPDLSVINYPNQKGEKCDLLFNAVDLAENTAQLGLPNFISSWFFRDNYVRIPSVYAAPATDSEIPLMASLDCAEGVTFSFDALISINKNAFLFDSDFADDCYYQDSLLYIKMSGEGLSFDSYEKKIASVKGRFFLVKDKITPITIEEFSLDYECDYVVTDGYVQIKEVCDPQQTIINSESRAYLEFYPNPANDILNLKASYDLLGDYTVEVYNINGEKLKEFAWKNSKSSRQEQEYIFALKEIPQGVYILRFSSPLYVKYDKFIYVK